MATKPRSERDLGGETSELATLEYPRTLYHSSSTPGNLIGKKFDTSEDAAAAGAGWGQASDLPFETAPSGRVTPPPVPAPTAPPPAYAADRER